MSDAPESPPGDEESLADSTERAADTAGELEHAPTLRERLRPLELLGISGALGIFAGLVTMLSTRQWILSLVVLGIAFVLSLVVLAMLALGGYEPTPPPEEGGVLGGGSDDERGGTETEIRDR